MATYNVDVNVALRAKLAVNACDEEVAREVAEAFVREWLARDERVAVEIRRLEALNQRYDCATN